MNELQKAICDKFSMVELVDRFAEASHIITPQGRMYELDGDNDIKLPTGIDSFYYITGADVMWDFLQKLGVIWVKHQLTDYTPGDVVPIHETRSEDKK